MNSSCREKLGELEVCKSEIGRLADVVEKRFTQVEDVFGSFIVQFSGEGGEGGRTATENQGSSFGGELAGGEDDYLLKMRLNLIFLG